MLSIWMLKSDVGLAPNGMLVLLSRFAQSTLVDRYLVNEDWKGQLEPSLIALKTTQLHKFHEVLRNSNLFLQAKRSSLTWCREKTD